VSDLFDLGGKVAIVTGSTRGIGLAIAEELARGGASVVVSSESTADTEQAASDLQAQGLCVHGIACDVTEQMALQALVEGAITQFGGIDVLVCNAGITGEPGNSGVDDFDRVMAINLRSQVALTGLALPHMASRTAPSVILIASISGLRGNANINAYALAKAGVAQLARNLAVQWGSKGVRVNAVSPGLIDTALAASFKADPAHMARRMAMTPLRRLGTVAEIAGAVRFLASPAAGYVNGHNLVVDGGTLVTDGS
jgi:NAD(P)-dependent dehydrogenase (short-subunit alcohol dehydrogenase family)